MQAEVDVYKRQVHILQRFLVHSQFVIITHNKRTIGMADVLYGVTISSLSVLAIVIGRVAVPATHYLGTATRRPSRCYSLISSMPPFM